ncbi:MAG: glycosyltransferase family 4 protein [Patescibacteria group bacterium]
MSRVLKILQINKFYYLKGGSERHMFDITQILEQKGHAVIPFSMQDPRNKTSEYDKYFISEVDLNKFSLKNIVKFFWNYDAVRKLEILIRNEKPDIAHLHNIAHQFSPAIIYVLKKHKIPVVQTLHDYKLICPNYKLFNKNKACLKCLNGKYYNCFLGECVKNSYLKSFLAMLEAYLYKWLRTYALVDLFIAPSQFMKDKCVESGIKEEKIKILRHFVDDKYFSINSEVGDYLLYFGRLSDEKGVDILFRAMRETNSGQRLKIVGAGPDYEKYKLKILDSRLSEKVELCGPKYDDELIGIVKQAKAIIMPSVWPENMPYSLLEAMAMGKVVIASRIGGMAEVINDKANGFLFRAGGEKELASIMNNLGNCNLEKIGEMARESASRNKKDEYCESLLRIYQGAERQARL